MRVRYRTIIYLLIAFACSCSNRGKSNGSINLDFLSIPSVEFDYEVLGFDSLSLDVNNEKNESTYMLSNIDKIVYKNEMLFISDWRHGKIVSFDRDGNGILSISKRGRGPQEYLKISDFDVDDECRIIIMDGQSDCIYFYNQNGKFLNSQKLPFEAYAFKVLNNGGYLFNLAPWNKGKGAGYKIAITDKSLHLLKHSIKYDGVYDSDYSFSSTAFTCSNSGITFNQPIDDNVYVLSNDGKQLVSYLFNFGSATVPIDIRKHIEANINSLLSYSFITNAVYADEHRIIGTLMERGEYRDFIVDLDNNVKYLQKEGSAIKLRTVSNGYAILQDLNNYTLFIVPVSSFYPR